MSAHRQAWPAAVTALPREGHAVIEASAGTGKTYTLEHLVAWLVVEEGVEIDRILVVTFTEKATRELRERVRTKLQELAAAAGGGEREARLKRALFGFDGATIATIHGFCQGVLTEQAFAGRRLFDQQHVDADAAFLRVYRDLVRETLATKDEVGEVLRTHLREEGVEDLGRRLYACARERGGLTPTWDPEAVRAACEALPDARAVEAAAKRAAEGRPRQAKKLLQHALTLYEALAAFASGDLYEASEAFEAVYKPVSVDGEKVPVAEHARGLLEAAADDEAAAAVVEALATVEAHRPSRFSFLVHRFLPRVSRRLEAHKSALGLFDFDDMLLLVRDALHGPDGDRLVRGLRSRWRVALIDEFQDTDDVQWEIFRRIFFESDAHRLIVVGDPKQAIYGFRGADVHTYLRARAEISAAGRPPVVLSENWRSTAPLIEAYNAIFERDFFTGSNAASYERPVRCGDESRSAVGADGEAAVPIRLVSLEPAGEGELTADAARRGLGEYIAREIRRIVDQGSLRFGERGEEGPIAYAQIHILTRTAFEGVAIGRILRRHDVPHAFYGQDGLFETDEAEDVLDLLSALARPRDRSARLKAWLTPFFGLSLADLDACRDLPDTDPLVARLLEWKALAERQAWGRLAESALDESGLVRRLLFARQGERELTNYQHLFEVLLEEAHRAPLTLADLVGRLRAFRDGREQPGGRTDGDVQRLETERAAVQILTMHKAKGLEAPVVFVAGGLTSSRQRGLRIYHAGGRRRAQLEGSRASSAVEEAIQREAREEDERLLYVALTRAKARLYLPLVPRRGNGGYGTLKGPHRVVSDRLHALLAAGAGEPLFAVDSVPCARGPADEDAPPDLSRWRPDEAALAPPPPEPIPFERLRSERAGVFVTSYTRMKHGYARHVPEGDEAAALLDDAEGEAAAPVEADPLPGGKVTGVFLHEALEEADYDLVRAAGGEDEFSAHPEVQGRFEALARRHGIDEAHLPRARALVYRALRTPIDLEDLHLPEGLCATGRRVPEMPFVYPVPEVHHPLLSSTAPAGAPYRVERGFVTGVVDLVFQHEGRYFFLDWKSDRLLRYDAAALDAHVGANYADQARIYTLAVLRTVGIADEAAYEAGFGGLLYCFLRGMGEGGAGLWATRPTWADAVGWERWLLEKDYGLGRRP